jgi:3-oxoacyl-[acyl-carrier protein] reductase
MSNASRVVLVTGGSKGLGLAMVRDFLSHGYRVATCSRNETDEVRQLSATESGDRFLWLSCEVGKEEEETSMFEKVVTWAGKDGAYALVNNAGIAGEGILATFPNVDSVKILEVNLLAALRLARLASRVMLAQAHGARIVNISSIVGLRGYSGLTAYSASKAGMDGLTRALARELGRRNITVNSVAPGYFESDISATLGARQRNQIVNRTPLGRLAGVVDIVPMIRFLLSDEAGFITGQTLVVDGGITC